MSRPISRTLLTHSAVLRKYSLSTSWDEPVLEESIALEYIRIEPMFEAVMTADEERPRLSGRMFFDCVNSLPTGLGFDLSLHRYTVEFMGEVYTVKKVVVFNDEGKAHHFEIVLS